MSNYCTMENLACTCIEIAPQNIVKFGEWHCEVLHNHTLVSCVQYGNTMYMHLAA
jgi:hypothetical protein